MEYKLIPSPLQKGEWLIISCEDVKKIDWMYIPKMNTIMKWRPLYNKKYCFRVISSTKFIDKSIPLIRKEQLIFPNSIDTIAEEFYNSKNYGESYDDGLFNGFRDGYNKHAETHPFTLEDIEKAISWGQENSELYDYEVHKEKEFIQSLQQPKKEYIVTIEIERGYEGMNGFIQSKAEISADKLVLRSKIDSKGYINILLIK